MQATSAHPLVVIVGPTGSGKTALALRLASELGGEIINCDSLQVYRHFNIGTAKPTPEELRRVPHHLLDILNPDQDFTAGDYARLARQCLPEIAARARLPVVAGGTGFYLKALLEGLAESPARDTELRRRLKARQERRPGSLHRLLRRFDPATACRIHPKDVNKTIRALEITLLARQPASSVFASGRQPLTGFRVWKLGLNPPRSQLYARIDIRAREMFDRGLLEEVHGILKLGYSPGAKPFESLGYRHALLHLSGKLSLEDAVLLTQRDTRRYAKRQLTWFRKDPDIRWIEGFGYCTAVQEKALQMLESWRAALAPVGPQNLNS